MYALDAERRGKKHRSNTPIVGAVFASETVQTGHIVANMTENPFIKKVVNRPKCCIKAKVCTTQYNYIRDLIHQRGIHDQSASWYFACHILGRRFAPKDSSFFVPIRRSMVRKFSRRPIETKGPLRNVGLLEEKPRDRMRKRCCEYRLPRDIHEAFIDIGLEALESADFRYVDLYNGRRCTAVEHSKLNDSHGNPWPEPVRGALETLNSSEFDFKAVGEHLARMKIACLAAKDAYVEAPAERKEEAKREWDLTRRRYYNDVRCYLSVARQSPVLTETSGIYAYKLAYRVQRTGRIGQVGGGLQNASRRMKYAAYSSIPGVANFDLRSTHAYILLQLSEDAGVGCEWLRAYLENSMLVETYCDYVGIPKHLWKRMFFALVNGGHLPVKAPSDKNSIANIIREYLPEEEVGGVMQRARELLEPLRVIKYELSEHFADSFDKTSRPCRGGRFVQNDAGMLLFERKARGRYDRTKRLMSFYLQGKEAAYIHHLTILSASFGYRVIANEHDGLVIIGELPEEAMAIAAEKANFRYAYLREKPIWEPEAPVFADGFSGSM